MPILHDQWEFDVLGIANYDNPGKLKPYFDWIKINHKKVDGDLAEAGVFNGKSLLSTGLLLKELGSDKRVYGFDSFSGFPSIYHAKDDISQFNDLYKTGRIDKTHYEAHQKLKKYRTILKNNDVTVKSISSSNDFSEVNLEKLIRKIELLGLDNIHIVKGSFSETMDDGKYINLHLMSCLLDCDLYQSYQLALPFFWKRLSFGGYLWLDEYYSLKFPGARIACDEYFSSCKEKPKMYPRLDGEFERWYVIKNQVSIQGDNNNEALKRNYPGSNNYFQQGPNIRS